MALDLVRRACRAVLRSALEALGPEPAKRPQTVSINKVEIRVTSDAKPGDIARQVAQDIATMRRYRKRPPPVTDFSAFRP